ncbi:MAG: outer membrane protein assembly factor BamE [Holosporaceae bacterium]|nr:outer membrane protein assembly factor BamE [Holosporaceae bacterium]
MRNCVANLLKLGFFMFISGCAFQGGSSGNRVIGSSNKAHIYKIINDNITTKSDARKILGDPSDVDYYEMSKQEKWTYLHIGKSNLMRNYIPIFNFFTRGTEDVHKKIILIFNSEGILVKSMVSESIAESKNGMFD